MNSNLALIRNFCVISHIDHGKTTLTDRFLELTHTLSSSKLKERILDSNPIEQERGITIKLAPVRLKYTLNSKVYQLNLIDTPGHVDFSYEVSRSLAACEGAILLVDATQGIQAQTLANANLALASGLELIPVINKIDIPNLDLDQISRQLQDTFGFTQPEIIFVSAKTGQNVVQLIEAVIDRLPPPQGDAQAPLQALIFNSFYHSHHGVIASVRLVNGQVVKNQTLKFFSNLTSFKPVDIGYYAPIFKSVDRLTSGEVGFIATGLKDISLCRVGDTLTTVDHPTAAPLPGYHEPQPVVYMDFYPLENHDFFKLKTSLEKFCLIDSSLHYSLVNSSILGSGYKIGFQGLLHAEIVQERLEREFGLELITTSPSVEYQVELKKKNQKVSLFSPADFPDPSLISQSFEPFIEITLFTPITYLGPVMDLASDYRSKLISQEFFSSQVKLVYSMPLQELISGFFDALKSVSSGFASLNWQFKGFVLSDIVKLEVWLNRQVIEPLSVLTIRSKAQKLALSLAKKLKSALPRQQFEVPIQVALGGKVLARETLKAYRKDVTVKLHASDLSRKAKLLEKQKKGKKRLKAFGRVTLNQDAFLAVIR
ncbi:MAG: translation elongation factor 4 [Candidatus Beckwithbacteria bacterium]